MLNMESPQMYDTVQTLSQLDLKKQPPPQQAIIGQITLTAMSSAQQQNNNANGSLNNPNSNNNNGTDANNNNNVGNLAAAAAVAAHQQNSGLVVKQHAVHQMQHAAAALNNNNNASTINANVNNVNNLLQKQMLQQYSQSDLDELTAQEITLDLQHLIDDQFREQEGLGIFSDMVTSPGGLSATLPPNGMVSAAAKVLQQHQLQQQSLRTQQHNYGRSALAYMPQAVHSGAAYSNNSSDENSSVGSDTSTIKEEPIDPEYRRHLQETNANNAAAAAFITNSGANGLYNPYQTTTNNGPVNNGVMNNGGSGAAPNFTNLTSANVLAHHSVNLPHLAAGAHLLKHHNKQLQHQRKSSLKHVDKGSEEYRRRRERNNIAVRKSREKAKVRSREVEERVKSLLKEKEALLRQLQEMTNEIQLHKQIYMQLMNHANPEVSRVCRSFLNTNEHGL
ncbi:CCAAT/enhancer-binding protein [Anastrepha obliqua]|uniref:CCAAT/enhancer-binding protein n=1 Tax=Anastrepha obliqua TaxID=95512 RepID=UPI00240A6FCD|nr:CCAAT/enhancer-binding protein [Anastrepha obliqua]